MKSTNFSATWKTGFPTKTRHNDFTSTRNTPQKMCCCLPKPTLPSLTLQRNLVASYGRSYNFKSHDHGICGC